MGTYTTNKNLFMPSVGEQGWGTLVNGNFSTIDTFLKPITVSGSTYTFTGNQSGGSVSATSISNSGTLTQTGTSTFTGKITGNGGIGTTSLTTSSTITSTGKITANGGIGTTSLTTSSTITSTGLITGNGGFKGFLYIGGTIGTSGDVVYAQCAAQSLSLTSFSSSSPNSLNINNYSITFGNPQKISHGIYCRRADLSGSPTSPTTSTRTMSFTFKNGNNSAVYFDGIYYKKSTSSSWIYGNAWDLGTDSQSNKYNAGTTRTIGNISVNVGDTYQFCFYRFAKNGFLHTF